MLPYPRPGLAAVLATALATLAPPVYAQHYGFQLLGRQAGLTNLEVQCIQQDHAGFLWVGTTNGLFRYDGSRFARFGTQQGLPSEFIGSLHASPDGTLWVATDVGAARLTGDRFVAVRLESPYEMHGPNAITSGSGTVYLATSRGVAAGHRTSSGEWIFSKLGARDPLASRTAYSVFSAPDGTVWFGCGKHLCFERGGTITTAGPDQALPERHWQAIGAMPGGDIWIRSSDDLFVFEKGSPYARPQRLNVAASNLSQTGRPAVDHAGRLLVPTLDGIAIGDRHTPFSYVSTAQGLGSESVSAVIEDREGSLWIGMAGYGLARWPGYGVWERWGHQEGLLGQSIWSLVTDARGTFWAATNRGMFRLRGQKWEQWPLTGIPHSEALWLAPAGPGKMWAGSFPQGLFAVDLATGAAERVGADAGLGKSWIAGLESDREDRLWVSMGDGLFRSAGGHGRSARFLRQEPPGSNPTEAFERCLTDRTGRVWAPGTRGLAIFDHGRWLRLTRHDGLLANTVRSLTEAPDGAIWVSYMAGPGISRVQLDGARAQITQLPGGQGPRSGHIVFLGFDSRGRLWAGTDNGVDAFDGKAWRHYDEADGLTWNDIDIQSFRAGSSGDVWIGTSRGLSHYLGTEPGLADAAPGVAITSVHFGSRTAETRSGSEICYRDRTLHIRFAALTFQNPDGNLFRYRLTGLDGRWTATADSELNISRLPAGDYQFEVMARSARGAWSKAPARFRFRIARPWYLRWWALAGAILLIGAAVRLAHRWWVRRLIARQQKLSALVAERTSELNAAKIRAEESNRLKSAFLSTLSHEIRTPMNGILGMADAVLQSDLTPEQRENIEVVKTSGESLLDILTDIVDLSKAEAGQLPLKYAPFFVRRCVREALGPVRAEAERKELQLTSKVADNVPAMLVGDCGRIRQILGHLLSNAVKFTENGFVRLEVTSRPAPGNRTEVQFTVTDSGIGIAPKHQRLVYEAFCQADNSSTRKHGGVGLGLTISAKLAEQMGGSIELESTPGRGSSFSFCASFERAATVLDTSNPVPGAAGRSEGGNGSILLVEDNIVNQKIALRALRRGGHAVTVANNGREALNEYESKPFDLILMDLQMPEMDGLAATAAIRERERTSGAHVPILALTAHALDSDRERCLAAGMEDYMTKPIKPKELLERVEFWISSRISR